MTSYCREAVLQQSNRGGHCTAFHSVSVVHASATVVCGSLSTVHTHLITIPFRCCLKICLFHSSSLFVLNIPSKHTVQCFRESQAAKVCLVSKDCAPFNDHRKTSVYFCDYRLTFILHHSLFLSSPLSLQPTQGSGRVHWWHRPPGAPV